ncbi:MAG: Blue-light-activated protein [Candidatus Hinthialibacteria bacterium OLB16]|nr:MAG: Blue-light-activated protein [Candidatus Hinthialibacteria bacterium OLB16]
MRIHASTMNPFLRFILVVISSFAGYLACSRISLMLLTQPENISAFWPPVGILFGLLMVIPRLHWAGILTGSFCGNVVANMLIGKSFPISFIFSIGDLGFAYLFSELAVRYLGRPVTLNSLREIFHILGLGGFGISTGCATWGALTLWLNQPVESFWLLWACWWSADIMGILIFTPVCLALIPGGYREIRSMNRARILEGCALLAVFSLLVLGIFGNRYESTRILGPLPFTFVPVLLISAIRFGVRGAALTTSAFGISSVIFTVNGFGPFASIFHSASEAIFRLQAFLAISNVSTLVVAGSIAERKKSLDDLARTERLYRKAIEIAGAVPYFGLYGKKDFEFVGEGIDKLTGIPASRFDHQKLADITLEIHPLGELNGKNADDAIETVREHHEIPWHADYRIQLPDGDIRWLANSAVQVLDGKGNAIGSLGILQDITERKKSEQAIARSEELYRSAIDGAGAVPYYRDYKTDARGEILSSRYSFMGKGIERITGYTPEEFTLELFEEILTDEIRYNPASAPGQSEIQPQFRAEYALRHKNGSICWVSDAAVDIHNEQGHFIASLGILQDITLRRQAEEEIRKTDLLYRSAIEGADAVPYYLNHRTVAYDFLGDGILNLTGFSSKEFTPEVFQTLILDRVFHAEMRGLTREQAMHRMRTEIGSCWRADYRIKTRHGEERWISDSAVQVLDDKKNVIGSLGILMDITDRRKSEDSIRIRDRALSFALNGIMITDASVPENPIMFVNPAFTKITGYQLEDMAGKTPYFLYEHGDHQEGLDIIRRAFTEGTAAEAVSPINRKDGQTIWGDIFIAPVRNDMDQVTHFICIQNDITDRMRIEKDQKVLIDGLRSIVGIADELLDCPDEDTITRMAVELGRERLGMERLAFHRMENETLFGTYGTDAQGNTIDEKSYKKQFDRKWFEALKIETGSNYQWYYIDGGHYSWNNGEMDQIGSGWVVMTPVASSQKWQGVFFNDTALSGKPYDPTRQELLAVYASLFSNIIERRRSEEARSKLEAQVHHTQKLESLGVLAGGIAHDFNNLLMGVLGNASLALMELPPESPARESVNHIEKAAMRAAELARQMLAYSGKGRFVIQKINLSKLVEEMTHLLQVSISKKVFLRYNFADNLPAIEGDATQIRQVIMNLITNASDAIGDKSGVITITTGLIETDSTYLESTYLKDDLPGGYYVFLEVSDTGCGMDEETRARIFDPFFTTKFTGRGLGLAAVLGIVRGHKGTVKVYSEAGRGTTFKILLPCCDSQEDTQENHVESTRKDWVGTGTILIVDDEESVRYISKRILESHGFKVLTANDGREGVKAYEAQKEAIDLVLLDMTMPHMDGEEAFRELRLINPDVHVILTSGYTEQEATARFTGKGLAGFIQKPFLPSSLLEIVRNKLSTS